MLFKDLSLPDEDTYNKYKYRIPQELDYWVNFFNNLLIYWLTFVMLKMKTFIESSDRIEN